MTQNINPGTLAFRRIREFNPVTRIVTLVCGHQFANHTARQIAASNGILECAKCSIPAKVKRARKRKPFWFAA